MSNIKTHRNGTVSELLAMAYFVSIGSVVSKPINDFNEYDLVIGSDLWNKLIRVQVKTIYFDNSKKRYLISCVTSHIRGSNRRINKKYTNKSFDLLCAIEKETMSVYLIPIEKILGRRSITFYPKGNINKTKKSNNFEEFKVNWVR